jgi:hypothetical protein
MELNRLFRRLPELDEDEKKIIASVIERLVNKFMHPCVSTLRRHMASSEVLVDELHAAAARERGHSSDCCRSGENQSEEIHESHRDHQRGSRLAQSAEQRATGGSGRRFTQRYAGDSLIVEPAHMELALPTVAQAYERCVRRGADDVLVCPFFLAEGKALAGRYPAPGRGGGGAISRKRAGASTAPLGVDDLIVALLAKRVQEAAVPRWRKGV